MLINKLIQDVQSCFRNPFSNEPDPFSRIVTRLYREHSDFIANAPVSVDHGYGTALGKSGTYKERAERFLQIVGFSYDTFKRLYTVNMNHVAGMLFVFDLGVAVLSVDERKESEQKKDLTVCGRTVLMLQEAVISEQLGQSMNQILIDISVLYKRLAGETDIMPESTGVILTENIIRMDRTAIESIAYRI